MAEIKKINTELQPIDKLLDTSGDAGTSGQILSTTGSGTNWIDNTGGGGTVTGTGATNRVAFWSDTTVLSSDYLFKWDDSNNRLGIGTESPAQSLHIVSTDGANIILNSNTGAENSGIWMTEAAAASPYTNGAYVYYDGTNNAFKINTGTTTLSTRFTIDRDTGVTTFAKNVIISTTDATAPGNLLTLYNTQNGGGASILFSDQNSSAQKGNLTFYHSDGASQGGGASFHFTSTEPNIAVISGDSSNNGRFLSKSLTSNSLADFSFVDDPNTGMLRSGVDTLRFVTGGTQALEINASQNATFTGSVHLDNDSAQLQLGDDNDMQIYHNGANGVIDNNTGDLIIRSDSDDIKILAEDDVVIRDNDDSTEMAKFINGGAVELYYSGSKKAWTSSSGFAVSGIITANDGSAAAPTHTFGDTDTGMYRVTTNSLGFTTGGTNALTLDSSQDATFAGNIIFSSGSDIIFPDNGGAALEFKEGSNLYMRFVTTNGSEGINMEKATTISNSLAVNSLNVNYGALSISGDNSNHATLTESSAGILTIATPDDFIVDAEGDIAFDANGGDIRLKDGGTQWGSLYTGGGGTHMYIESAISDKDIIFKGNDGGSTITALTLDMSGAGAATFNNNVTCVNLIAGTAVYANQGIYYGTSIMQLKDNSSNPFLQFDANKDATFYGDIALGSYKATSGATITGDGSTTLTTKGYVDGLITGATLYQDPWDARTSAEGGSGAGGNPDLTTGSDGTSPKINGYYFIVSNAGSATPNGPNTTPNSWHVGDWVIWNDHSGSAEWQKIDNSSVLSGVGTGQTVALWQGTNAVTDSETLGNAPITFSTNDATFAGDIAVTGNVDVNAGEVQMDDNYSIQWGGNAILKHTGSQTYLGDNSSSTVLTLASGDATFAGTITSAGLTVDGAVNLDVMPTHESEGIIKIGRYDANTSRYNDIKSYVSSTAASNYLKFCLHNGTVNTVVDVLTLKGDQSATFAGDVSINNSKFLKLQRSSGSLFTDAIGILAGTDDVRFLTTGEFDFVNGSLTNLLNISNAGNATFAGDVAVNGGRITITESGNQNELLIMNASSDVYADQVWADSGGSIRLRSHNGAFKIYTGGDANSLSANNSTEGFSLSTSQNATFAGGVGINMTPTTDYALTAKSLIASGGYTILAYNSDGERMAGFYQTTTKDGELYLKSDGDVSKVKISSITDSYLNGGNVGINTTSPSHKLHVIGDQLIFGDLLLEGSANSFRTVSMNTSDGSDNQTLSLCGGATASSARGGRVEIKGNEADGSVVLVAGNVSTGDIDFYTANSQRMIINNAGNVGIGVTSPTTGNLVLPQEESTQFKIAFTGASSSSGISTVDQSGSGLYIGANSRVNSSGNVVYHDSALPSSGIYFDGWNGDDMEFYTGTSGNPSVRLTIASDGTATFAGDVTISKAATPLFKLLDTTNNISLLLGADDANTFIRSSSSANLYLQPGGSTALTLLSGGNVGIGLTDPDSKLHVNSGIASTSDWGNIGIISDFPINTANRIYSAYMLQDTSAPRGAAIGLSYDGTGYKMHFGTSPTDSTSLSISTALTIDRSGNVGIGTTAPVTPLTVAGGLLVRTTTADSYENRFQVVPGGAADAANVYVYDGAEAVKVRLNAGGDSYLNGGNVGIGTTSPDAKLDVESTHSQLRLTDSDDSKYALFSYSSSYLSIRNNSTSAVHWALDTSGNVGIGTIDPYAYDTTSTKLHVKNASAGSGAVGEVARFEGSSDADGSGGTIRLGTSNDRGMYFEGGRTSTVPYGKIGLTEYNGAKTLSMTLDWEGGTTFAGDVNIAEASNKGQLFFGTANTDYEIKGGGNYGYLSLNAPILRFDTGGTERLRIDANGAATFTEEIYVPNGSKAAPTYSFTGDTNTGMYSDAADRLSLVAGGNTTFEITATTIALNAATTLTSSNLILSGDANIELDVTPGSGNASGTIIKTGTTVVAYGTCYMLQSGPSWAPTEVEDEEFSKGLLAIGLGAGAANSVGMLTNGIYYDSAHGFSIGAPLYLVGDSGLIDDTAPSGSGDLVRVVGYAIDDNEIYFCPDTTWVILD